MPYSTPQINPQFVELIMQQSDPEAVQNALILFTMGLMQGLSCMMREHSMGLLLEGFKEDYVDGWLDAADTLDFDPPPRSSAKEEKEAG